MLARHHINLQLAKITTLGERVEDTFLIDGPGLQQNRIQLQIETELLDALALMMPHMLLTITAAEALSHPHRFQHA